MQSIYYCNKWNAMGMETNISMDVDEMEDVQECVWMK